MYQIILKIGARQKYILEKGIKKNYFCIIKKLDTTRKNKESRERDLLLRKSTAN